MDLQLVTLFTLSTQHPYFANGSANQVISIGTPLGDAAPQLWVKEMAERFLVYGKNLSPAMIQYPILVPIYISDPTFLNYTELDTGLTPDAQANIQVSNNYSMKVLWLTSDEVDKGVLKANQTSVFPVQPHRFSVNLTKGDPILKVTRVHLKSAYGTHYELVPPVGTTCDIDLTDKPKGRYNLVVGWEGGSEETYTFVALQYLPAQLPFALLRLYPEQLIAGYPDEITGLSNPEFQISFTPRAVTWNYHLINLQESDLQKATITATGAGTPDIEFTRPSGSHTLPNGQIAYRFHSKHPLELHQRPGFQLKLSLSSNTFGEISLPFPNPTNVRMVDPTKKQEEEDAKEKETGFFVDVYVYL